MIDKLEKAECVGCKACSDICPKDAIFFETDKEGFWYPRIDKKKCIDCNLCERVCPHINIPNNTDFEQPLIFAAYSLNSEIRYKSTSGGIYYELAKAFIDAGGYIVGCVYDSDFKGAHHVIGNTLEDLKHIMGSKYFQSDTENIYEKVKKILGTGKKVLFCGAPCQTAALLNYVGEKKDNLYTVDFICRGINSPLAYKMFIKELERKYNSTIKEVHFKDKSKGWVNLGTRVEFENGKKYFQTKHMDPWVSAFIFGNLYMRPSCHNCDYKQLPRKSDISLGDFWGLDFTIDEGKKGVSIIMVNNSKGKELLEMCKRQIWCEQHTLREACEGNGAILNVSPIGEKRNEFFEMLENQPFSTVVWKLLGKNYFSRKKSAIIETIKTNIWLKKNTIKNVENIKDKNGI